MSQSVARSEKILNRLADRTGLTDAAVQFLIVALDPFHDNPTNCSGIPDGTLGNSVVQCIKKSVTIQAPKTIITDMTNTWDCKITMHPFTANNAQALSFMNVRAQQKANAVTYSDTTTPFRQVGPINILAYPTGDTLEYNNPYQAGAVTDDYHQTTNIFLDGAYSNGIYRVVGQGFEVLNTTAQLYTQGLCTVWRTPVPSLADNNCVTGYHQTAPDVITPPFAAPCVVIPGPPNTTSEALALPNTKQWLAKEGCYVVGRFNDLEQNNLNNSYIQPFIQKGSDANIEYGYMPNTVGITFGTSVAQGCREIQWSNMDISGCHLTGLHPLSSITVNWNIYIERFPSRQEAFGGVG